MAECRRLPGPWPARNRAGCASGPGPGAGWLGTSGVLGPGTHVEVARPETRSRTRSHEPDVGSRGGARRVVLRAGRPDRPGPKRGLAHTLTRARSHCLGTEWGCRERHPGRLDRVCTGLAASSAHIRAGSRTYDNQRSKHGPYPAGPTADSGLGEEAGLREAETGSGAVTRVAQVLQHCFGRASARARAAACADASSITPCTSISPTDSLSKASPSMHRCRTEPERGSPPTCDHRRAVEPERPTPMAAVAYK